MAPFFFKKRKKKEKKKKKKKINSFLNPFSKKEKEKKRFVSYFKFCKFKRNLFFQK